jgi:hypothetical protein
VVVVGVPGDHPDHHHRSVARRRVVADCGAGKRGILLCDRTTKWIKCRLITNTHATKRCRRDTERICLEDGERERERENCIAWGMDFRGNLSYTETSKNCKTNALDSTSSLTSEYKQGTCCLTSTTLISLSTSLNV